MCSDIEGNDKYRALSLLLFQALWVVIVEANLWHTILVKWNLLGREKLMVCMQIYLKPVQ